MTSGVDLGPDLARAIADRRGVDPAAPASSTSQRIRALLRRRRTRRGSCSPTSTTARTGWPPRAAEDVPVAAVQHGVISPLHTGYIHGSRPPQLRLPGRTYVFGTWERDLLTRHSVYRPEEVVVGGSPRLDLVDQRRRAAAWPDDALRRELGVASGDRLVVLSGTWGVQQRRFHYPIALAGLFAAPLERVHVVVKLHPSEKDEGPYRAVIEGVAAAGGFAPPPVTVVQTVDLYRLLAAADAHLGIHSTLLTEAVATGTPNLLAAGLAGADLLGYVEAGVAVPVRTAADIAAVLDRPRERGHARRATGRRSCAPTSSPATPAAGSRTASSPGWAAGPVPRGVQARGRWAGGFDSAGGLAAAERVAPRRPARSRPSPATASGRCPPR